MLLRSLEMVEWSREMWTPCFLKAHINGIYSHSSCNIWYIFRPFGPFPVQKGFFFLCANALVGLAGCQTYFLSFILISRGTRRTTLVFDGINCTSSDSRALHLLYVSGPNLGHYKSCWLAAVPCFPELDWLTIFFHPYPVIASIIYSLLVSHVSTFETFL